MALTAVNLYVYLILLLAGNKKQQHYLVVSLDQFTFLLLRKQILNLCQLILLPKKLLNQLYKTVQHSNMEGGE